MMRALSTASVVIIGLATLPACASVGGLSPPFNAMRSAPITILRLQNFDLPPAQPQAAVAPLGLQIPPQIQEWINAGAHMLPPGLIPPGLLPGTAPPPTQDNAQRFHGFRVLGWTALSDPKLHDEVLNLLGHESNFVPQHGSCMYAEFGVSIGQPNNQPPADYLISLSCNQVQSASPPPWPYAENGVPAETAKGIVALVQRAFGGG
jgi:hypothetical protein